MNQENLFKLYKKFNQMEPLMGMAEELVEEVKDDEQWDGRLRMKGN